MFDTTDNNVVIIKPEMLLIQCFKKIHEELSQDEAYRHFAYIYFKYDFKSPYRRSSEGKELEEKIKEEVIGDIKWQPTDYVVEAAKVYQELQQVKSLKVLDSAEKALSQISKYFNEFKLDTLSADKKHIAVNNMMKNLKEVGDVIDEVASVRRRVESELLNKSIAGKRTLGKREIPPNQR